MAENQRSPDERAKHDEADHLKKTAMPGDYIG
jgi:hypothetical protein